MVVDALAGLKGDLSGKYYSLTQMTEKEQQQLINVSDAAGLKAFKEHSVDLLEGKKSCLLKGLKSNTSRSYWLCSLYNHINKLP